MMQRRSFLRYILPATLTTAAVAQTNRTTGAEATGIIPTWMLILDSDSISTFNTVPDNWESSRWRFIWTGWKASMESLLLVSQWVAWRKEESSHVWLPPKNMAVSCSSGSLAWHQALDIFDLSYYPGGNLINLASTEEDKRKSRDACLTRLLRFLREEGEEL